MQQVEAVYSVLLADVNIYAVDPDGAPVGDPIWVAKCFEQIRIAERYMERVTYPTGTKYGIPHHINEEHQITLVGLMDPSFSALGLRNMPLVIFIQWPQASSGGSRWTTRTYYGAKALGVDTTGQGDNAVSQGMSFRSQFFIQSQGTGDITPPVESGSSS